MQRGHWDRQVSKTTQIRVSQMQCEPKKWGRKVHTVQLSSTYTRYEVKGNSAMLFEVRIVVTPGCTGVTLCGAADICSAPGWGEQLVRHQQTVRLENMSRVCACVCVCLKNKT